MYLGIDLGTSGLKALILDEASQIVAMAKVPLEVQRPSQGHSEQDPADWIKALREALGQLREHLPQVQSIGLAGHMHGLVLLDKADQVLRPCILWNDMRAESQAQSLDAQEPFHRINGNLVFPGFSAPKMAWVRDEEPEIWRQAHTMLLPKDYLGLWLTGQKQAEPSDAAGSSLFDCAQSTWSEALCAVAEISPDILPPLVKSDAPRGTLHKELVEEFGFSAHVVVAGGAGDNAAAALGAGCLSNGQSLLSLGTSGVLLTVNEAWQPDPRTAVHSFNHAIVDRYIQMGVTLSATDSLVWLGDLLRRSPQELCAALPQYPSTPGSIVFHPYLSGERTPHNFAGGAGSFLNLDRRHGEADLTRAVLEGVAYSFADCCSALEAAGAEVGPLRLVGGGGNIAFLVQTIANVLGRPIEKLAQADHVAAIGAAYLGKAATHDLSVLDVAGQNEPATTDHILPNQEAADAYAQALQSYRAIFESLRKL